MACCGVELADLLNARAVLDDVFARVAQGSLYARPIGERHRIVFYLGHVEAFDRNLLAEAAGLAPRSVDLNRLFAFGIDPPPGCAPVDTVADWPVVEAVERYRGETRREMEEVWERAPEALRHVAIEHRLMHAETLAYMLHNLEPDQLVAPAMEADCQAPLRSAQRCVVQAGVAVLGRDSAEGFGWDNEFPKVEQAVPAFAVDQWKVTNGQYLDYMRDTGASAPHFWRRGDDGVSWMLRRMFTLSQLPLDWPVYVTQRQAAAWAAWAGARLMTEAEWHRANEGAPSVGGNVDARRWDPEPVSCGADTASASGVEQLSGNGWEWTSSLFRPFPGFREFSFYPGYSAAFFDDDHYVLKGGSPRTDGVFSRRASFRNWFRKDYPYVFATFRCVHNIT